MKRRALLAALPATMAATGASAQPASLPRIAYLSGRSFATDAYLLDAFREGLKAMGFVEGQNVVIDVRWADGFYDQVPKLAADVVAAKPTLIAAVGGNPVSLAVKAATSAIPVVFGSGGDPVALGIVGNLARPEGNLTGIALWAQELEAKRIDLLHEMLPQARSIALLVNPTNPGAKSGEVAKALEAAAALGLKTEVLEASSSVEIERALAPLPPGKFDALAVAADAFLINRRRRITALAAWHKLPAIYPAREFVEDGGLASWGTRWAQMYGVLGGYAARILKGAKPADLPVQRPTAYELVINTRTARSHGLQLPATFVGHANEAIE